MSTTMNKNKFAIALATALTIFTTTTNVQAGLNGTTATGLDTIVDIINTDARLNRRVSAENIDKASVAADAMNRIIVKAIIDTGVANDNDLSTADTRELNDYIFINHYEEWLEHHGDDDGGVETGFHLVQGNGARTRLFDKNAINKVADGIYHLGFETHRKNRLMNEDGNKNASFAKVSEWLNGLLANDLQGNDLQNTAVSEVTGTTGTGLDQFIDIIYFDPGLQKKISTGDIREGAAGANGMNEIIVSAIRATGIAADSTFDKADMQLLSAYIKENHYSEWLVYHGDDEDGIETGFHLVQSDGAKLRMFDKNAVNKVADGIYHLGFGTNARGNRLINEDGNNNVNLRVLAGWLNQVLADDLADGSLN